MTLSRWRPHLAGVGPARSGLATVSAALADLHRLADGELIVEPHRDAGWSADAQATLVGWACTVGYARVWLPDRVVDLHDALIGTGLAEVICPVCDASWSDSDPSFWALVVEQGRFPDLCLACGGTLPQWTIAFPA